MIFYDFDLFAPNPWIAWIFAQEKGLPLERRLVDLFTRENRREPFISTINPLGELPALQLDDGTAICEVTAICEYFEDIQPEPPLIGSTPEERAETRMWVRRIDQNIAWPMGEGFSTEEVNKVLESGGKLPMHELLRCRVRYFSDGLAIGSKEFVEKIFKRYPGHFGDKRKQGARNMRFGDWLGLRTLRDLRLDPVSRS
jgi:hypothetical protein